ncbi:MAG TPA: hypothetical protein VLF60_01110 [Candidatus Saccharimonadales bacterium]|nr:hypothetical protein [Candidatus Saccharimonadales bacterium]
MFEQGDTFYTGSQQPEQLDSYQPRADDTAATQPSMEDEQAGLAAQQDKLSLPPEAVLKDESPLGPGRKSDQTPVDAAESLEAQAPPLAQGGGGDMLPPPGDRIPPPSDDDGENGDDESEERFEIAETFVQPGDIIAERRLVNGTPVTAVLFTGDVDQAPEVAAAVVDCDVVIITPVMDAYADEEHRQDHEEKCNELASRTADPFWRGVVAEAAAEHQIQEAAIASELRDTDKRIKIVALTNEDYRQANIPDYSNTGPELTAKTTSDIPPLEEVRASLYRLAEFHAQVAHLEAAKLSGEVQEVLEEAGRRGQSVGVVMSSALHCELIDVLGGEASRESPISLPELAEQALEQMARPRIAALQGDIKRTVQLIDRSVFALYTRYGAMSLGESEEIFTAIGEFASVIDVPSMGQALNDLGPQLAAPDLLLEEKARITANFATPILATMRERGFL